MTDPYELYSARGLGPARGHVRAQAKSVYVGILTPPLEGLRVAMSVIV